MENNLLSGTIEAVLFDLDGTLMETDDHMVSRLAAVLSRLRLRNPVRLSRRIVMQAETPVNGLITLFDRLGVDRAVMALFRRGKKVQGKTARPPHPMMVGVGEMLSSLKGKFRLGLVTSNSQEEAERFMAENGITGFFDVLVTRSSVRRLKPHPEPVLVAASLLGTEPGKCLMVGDTTPDMKSAVAAGAIPVGVLCGFGTERELLKAGAEMILEETRQLMDWLPLAPQ